MNTGGRKTLNGFLITGKDRHFIRANMRLGYNSGIVITKELTKPEAVRYAWADNTGYNLLNGYKLLAFSFRTDCCKE